MKQFLVLAMMATIICSFRPIPQADPASPIGRWDLTVNRDGRKVPSWLEVKLSGIETLVGAFVADGGSARPISKVFFRDGRLSFTIPPQWERTEKQMVLEADLIGADSIKGRILASNGQTYEFTGVRAPSLKREGSISWGQPVKLLNSTNLDGWEPMGNMTRNQWENKNGVLTSPRSGLNIRTKDVYTDFQLHIELRYPAGSNSGVYLRGRYEVQVEDNYGKEPSSTYFGGIYGFLTPNEMAAKPAGEWQSFDITLVGRKVTVVANGKTIICDQLIPGITGGAIDSHEGQPGPIMLQGDHGPVEYRNITIRKAQ
jgi:hypothetical protein